ncbi:2-isopropylmalate synthase [Helicovermis profundi]|uniref:2-isopropylmalate synthase n=1 Tax=Helicovermis profundi TaxID=3065157 RepID=A0AAU9E550_9FIRM|nr:2-isopropylmalate synthase [Clostridia bacterium S502]
MKNHIKIFDTTLRDGEQSPGCSMNTKEKLELAKQLEKLGVDVIEAGFPAASNGDFEAVKLIANTLNTSTVAGLSRALKSDIDRTWEAIKDAKKPRIHTFIATSDLHMEYKLKKSKEEVLKIAVDMVSHAKNYCEDIEFSAEDASRSDWDFLCQVFESVIKAGATVLNIPDTVGYTVPSEYYDLISYVKNNVKGIENVDISVHCHNDLGMGTANSLSAIKAGANQIECTINGIGERAGNTALEEVVMAINTRKDFFNNYTNVNSTYLTATSKLLTSITGIHVQPNKAIVGENAFSHEAGIHQHGVLNNKETYEIMTPESVGLNKNKMVLGKHSGRHIFEDYLIKSGYSLSKNELNAAFVKFKDLADKKKKVYARDIDAIVREESIKIIDTFYLEDFSISTGKTSTSSAIITLKRGDDVVKEVAMGDGPIDAAYNAILKIVNLKLNLEDYTINSITEGRDAQGEAVVKLKHNEKIYTGRAINTDIIASSIEAYLNSINKIYNDIENLQ